MAQKMNGTESLNDALERLTKAGYSESFRASNGQLKSASGSYDPSEFTVDTVVRFEGATDLDEEAAIFALTHMKSNTKGVYVVAFGPQMDTDDVDIVQKLHKS
jgi:hypothetical protein